MCEDAYQKEASGRFSFLRCFTDFRLSVLLESRGCPCTAEVGRILPKEPTAPPALLEPLHVGVPGEAWRLGFFSVAFPRGFQRETKNASCSTQLSSTWLSPIELVPSKFKSSRLNQVPAILTRGNQVAHPQVVFSSKQALPHSPSLQGLQADHS